MLILPQKLFERIILIKICRSLSRLKHWSFFLGFRFFFLNCMCHTFRSYILLHISIIIIMYICILVLLTLFCRIIISSLDSLVAKTSFEHTPRGSIQQGGVYIKGELLLLVKTSLTMMQARLTHSISILEVS